MTEQLKQAAQQALEAFDAFADADDFATLFDLIRKMNVLRDLTTSQPAQAGEVDERVAFEVWARPNGYDLRRNAVLGHYSSIDTLRAWNGWQARASLPTQPAAQTTRTTADTLREIKAASCKDCGASGYTDPGEPDSPDGPGRPAVVCGACMGTGWRNGAHISDQQATPEPLTPDQQSALKQALFKSARIVEQPPQQAAGEPVGEIVRDTLGRNGRPWLGVTWAPGIDLPEGTKIYTHPAPAVPEAKCRLCDGSGITGSFQENDGPEQICYCACSAGEAALAAAQAKGGE